MEEFVACFAEVFDPRQDNARHNLHEILMIALCTLLCGGEDCSDMEAVWPGQTSHSCASFCA